MNKIKKLIRMTFNLKKNKMKFNNKPVALLTFYFRVQQARFFEKMRMTDKLIFKFDFIIFRQIKKYYKSAK